MRGAFLLLVVTLISTAARADERLSDRGNQLVDGVLGASWSNGSTPGTYVRPPEFQLWLHPSWIYFVRDRVGVGTYAGYELARETQTVAWTGSLGSGSRIDKLFAHQLSFGVSFAFELFARGRIGLYGRPYLGWSRTWREQLELALPGRQQSLPGDHHVEQQRQWRTQVGLRLPLLYQLSARLGIGLGPDLQINLPPGDTYVRFGVSSWIARAF